MALPEIPNSWFQFAQLIVTLLLAVLGAVGYSSLRSGQERHGEVLTTIHEKQEVNGAKIDAAATNAAEAKTILATKTTATDAKIDDLANKVTALPPAVASAVQKGKDK